MRRAVRWRGFFVSMYHVKGLPTVRWFAVAGRRGFIFIETRERITFGEIVRGEGCTDLRYKKELPGHKSSKTTEIYTHVSTKSLQNIKSPFDDLF